MDVKIRETESLWKAWTTVVQMLTDRGRDIPKNYTLSFEEFEEWVGNADEDASEARKKMYYTIPANSKQGGISVFWKELLGTSDVQEMVEMMNTKNIKHAIAIHNNKVTPYATSALRLLKMQKIIIEVFSQNELQYNVTHHEYVPRHIICSAKTKQQVFEAYNIDSTKIVKILTTDPVIRYLGALKGQLIKIVRESDCMPEVELPIEGESDRKEKKKLYDVTYRIVA